MRKFGFATLIAGGLIGAAVGLAPSGEAATTAQPPAGGTLRRRYSDSISATVAWINQIQPRVHVPHVSTEVHQSR